jgi:hypothetical protein
LWSSNLLDIGEASDEGLELTGVDIRKFKLDLIRVSEELDSIRIDKHDSDNIDEHDSDNSDVSCDSAKFGPDSLFDAISCSEGIIKLEFRNTKSLLDHKSFFSPL